MAYLVLARKYRPQTFSEVVRQEHVTRTLTNAIRADRVAHAILFAGPRGTGKTTIARILAKSMNCEAGPTPEPCNECRSCREIAAGHASDVLEIDGASNNGVDHIRDLRENARYMPVHSRFKIYVIDEVHMLSTAAFNALLKTLEEPPAHVMFLFATTEPHKIPITILSRCQRHDLRRIETADVVRHMGELCRREGIAMAEESLSLIAREAGGSMRDALSLLDHVMACAEGEVDHKQVLDILGVVDRDAIFRLADALLTRDVPAALALIDEVYDHGHNLKELYGALLEHFRNLLVVRMSREAGDLVDATDQERRRMAQSVREVSETHLSQLLDVLFREEATIRHSAQPRIALEMACFRMFQVRPALPIETLIEKLDGLSRGVLTEAELERPNPLDVPSSPVRPEISADGHGTPPAGSAPGTSAFTDSGRTAADSAPTSADSSPASESASTEAVHEKSEPASALEPTSAFDSVRAPSRAPAAVAASVSGEAVESVSASATVESASNKSFRPAETAVSASFEGLGEKTEMPSAPARRREAGYSAPDSGDGHRVSEDVPAAEAAPAVGAPSGAAPSMATGSTENISGGSVESAEPVSDQTAAPAGPSGDGDAILERAAAQVPESLSSLLRKCQLTSVEPDALVLEINAADFHIKRLEKQERTLQKIFSDVTGSSVRLTLKKGVESGGPGPDRAAEANRRREEALNHPLVAAAMEIFEGTLIDVKPLSEESSNEGHGQHDEAGPEASVQNDENAGRAGKGDGGGQRRRRHGESGGQRQAANHLH